MSDIILNITQSETIEKEVDTFRQYLYARQLFYKHFKRVADMGCIHAEAEMREIEEALWSLYNSPMD